MQSTNYKRSCIRIPALAFFVAIIFACTQIEERYETANLAREQGLFERGWVPDVLPDGAGPIVELHDLDTNARCSRSEVSDEDIELVARNLLRLGFTNYSERLPPLPFVKCPFSLAETQEGARLFIRTSMHDQEVVALMSKPGRMLFWSSETASDTS